MFPCSSLHQNLPTYEEKKKENVFFLIIAFLLSPYWSIGYLAVGLFFPLFFFPYVRRGSGVLSPATHAHLLFSFFLSRQHNTKYNTNIHGRSIRPGI
jgi:hypothetical protein